MLELKVYDGSREVVLKFEHSLRSISKWEQKNQKPFLTHNRSALEMIDYFKEMLLNTDESPELIYALSPEQLEKLGKYINSPETASSVTDDEKSTGIKEQVTSELVYYWMTELNIPWEAQDWHYNRLTMLVRIANHKKQAANPKKTNRKSFMKDWRSANESNRQRFNSNG